jgi:hypothetical protein
MNATRNGKIARLPKDVRHQLNHRLEDGEPGNQFVDWPNGLPQVQKTLPPDQTESNPIKPDQTLQPSSEAPPHPRSATRERTKKAM